MNLNIAPDPLGCADRPGGVNSVVYDHAVGFLNAGVSINQGAGVNIAHAVSQIDDLDVFHCHGLYPIGKDYFDHSYSKANQTVLENAIRAKVTVCISEFSANILRHRLHIDPIVTRNGIFVKDYRAAGAASGPVLFPKVSLDANAKPDSAVWLRDHSDLELISMAKIPGVKSLGNLARSAFLKVLQGCSVYLATTKENNSMASMESMISGVPLVGYNFGFSKEWLVSGVGCELVPPGDQPALLDAIRKVQADWSRYSKAARDFAHIFDWKPVIDELIKLYSRVEKGIEDQSVSIVIPCHNYEQWIGEAIESALAQTVGCEIIAIDDHSTDGSWNVIKRYADRIKTIRNDSNLGVANTRNLAIEQATGRFIVCLDADDRLKPDFVKVHLAAFRTREDAITYAPIELIEETGKPGGGLMFRNVALPAMQRSGKNQIPSCCMFRKTFWQRAGGYASQYSPAEDANLWLKIFALGGVPRRASKDPLMEYRMHKNSLSSKGFPNWWEPFRMWNSDPIQERDPNTTFILESSIGAMETLWSLENQSVPNWACHLPNPKPGLIKTFPWLNRGVDFGQTRITIEAGRTLPPEFLKEYAEQMPAWLESPRLRLSFPHSSEMIKI